MRSPTRSSAATWRSSRTSSAICLLQVVFHSRMAEEAGLFDLGDVATAISDKMERRHPHIFGDVEHGGHHLWEQTKAGRARGQGREQRIGRRRARPARAAARREDPEARRAPPASTGPTPPVRAPRSTRRSPRSMLPRRSRNARPRSAICSSRWSISPAITASTPKRRCAARSSGSRRGSGGSRRSLRSR